MWVCLNAVVAIGAAMFALQQLSGINAVFYFSSTVFRNAGISSDLIASVSVGAVNLLGMTLYKYGPFSISRH